MSCYNAIHLRLKFYSILPTPVVELLQCLIGGDYKPSFLTNFHISEEKFLELQYLFNGRCVYLWGDQNKQQFFKPFGSSWVFEIFSAVKHPNISCIRQFIELMLPYLDILPNQVLYREVGEEDRVETILVYRHGGQLEETQGYWYYDPDDDPEHPRNDKSMLFRPSMVYEVLLSLVARKKEKYKDYSIR